MHTRKDEREEAKRVADEFDALFRQMEHAMKRCNFCNDSKENAEADWDKLSRALGKEFYDEVAASRMATTLLRRRPRKLKREPMAWQPLEALPITNVKELFVNGVCQVRNNLFHGEKLRGSEQSRARDVALLAESEWVLKLVLAKLPQLREHRVVIEFSLLL
jgi:hypothetical protein